MNVTPFFFLLADGETASIIARLTNWQFLEALVPVLAIVVLGVLGGVLGGMKMWFHHRERIAKIQMGIDPDAPPQPTEPPKDHTWGQP